MTASDGAGPDRDDPMHRALLALSDTLDPHEGPVILAWGVAALAAALTKALADRGWVLTDANPTRPVSVAPTSVDLPTPLVNEPRQHCDRCHRPLPHTDAERAACPPADGVEVREEWGVRWLGDDPQFTCRSREEAQRERDLWNDMHMDATAEVVGRKTSAWQTVTDDRQESQP